MMTSIDEVNNSYYYKNARVSPVMCNEYDDQL